MKAPNGNESKLNESDWNYVRTTEFKAWFGDWENDQHNSSKMIDINGEPKIYYHGTKYDFFEFKDNKDGIHFGSLDQAKMRNSKIIIGCFLNIRSLARKVDTIGHWWNVVKSTKRKHDGIVYLNRYEGIALDEFQAVRNKGITDDTLDGMNDAGFKKLIKTATDSYIVFDKNQIKIIGKN